MMKKIDFKKELDAYRAKNGEFRILEIPNMRYLAIDGHGDPNTAAEYTTAIETLYPLAYKLKFASKDELGRDYVVPPLEGLWWADDMDSFTAARDKSQWSWTLMLMVPDWIDHELYEAALERTEATRLDEVELRTLAEGLCVQTLHIGSFDDEADVLEELHETFIPSEGLRMVGIHHEIYLSDFRRVAPEKRRTILRQPVEGAAKVDG